MAKKELKTNVMRVLDSKKLAYNHYTYDNSTVNGVEVAQLLGQEPDRVFKTLVTRGKSGGFFVFMVPVAEELDLKKAARACGEKAVEMLPQKELLPRTGYVHGGCSPIGMKKQFPTYIHQTAAEYDTKKPLLCSCKARAFLYLFVKYAFYTRKSLYFFQIIC